MAKTDPEEVNFLDLLVSFFNALRRNALLAILLPLAGAGLAIGVILISDKRAESNLLIETSLLSESECLFLFDQIEKAHSLPGLSKEERAQLVALELDVKKKEASPTPAQMPWNDQPLYMNVRAEVTNEQVFPSIEAAVVQLVANNEALQRRRSARIQFYSGLIKRIDAEIASMEEIKNQVSGNVQATYLNPAELYSKTVDLYKEKLLLEMRVEELESLHIVKTFQSAITYNQGNLVRGAIIGFALGIVCLFIVLFFQFFRNYLYAHQPAS